MAADNAVFEFVCERIEALSDTLSRLGQHEELIDLLERRAALAAGEPETRGSVLFELGRIQEERLDDRDSARHAYERAHEAWPSGPGVADALERLYRKQEDWRALRQIFGGVCLAHSCSPNPVSPFSSR